MQPVVYCAGIGNIAILRNMAANRSFVRCSSASVSQYHRACLTSRPHVFTNRRFRLVNNHDSQTRPYMC